MAERRHYKRPNGDAYADWRDEAACSGMDADLFELQDSEEVDEESQWELIAWGLSVCTGCPVRASCLSEASDHDLHWTIRGGQPPEGLFPDSKAPKNVIYDAGLQPSRQKGKAKPSLRRDTCERGHKDWVLEKSGKRRCRTCVRIYNAGRFERRRLKEEAKAATMTG